MLMPLSLDTPLPPLDLASLSFDELLLILPLEDMLLLFDRTPASSILHFPFGPNLISSRAPCMGTIPHPRPRDLSAHARAGGRLDWMTGSGDWNWT